MLTVPQALDRTPEFERALSLMESKRPFVFITGRAGTGKSTLLRYFRNTSPLLFPVLAPTGVAALNVDGETIHRFFGFAPDISAKNAARMGAMAREEEWGETYQNINALVIDEISMLRADLLDCMDRFLRAARRSNRPFGGLRVIAIGDLYQLPPVVTSSEREVFSELYESPYFFASAAFKRLWNEGGVEFVELEKVYRQSDAAFIGLLNGVRDRSITTEELRRLNVRVGSLIDSEAITLTATNAAADAINDARLEKIPEEAFTFEGRFSGEFSEREAPTDPELRLKTGARVMCVANDSEDRFVNGSLGWIAGFEEDDNGNVLVRVVLDDGKSFAVGTHTWTLFKSVYDKKTKTLTEERIGSYAQIPLRLAWAVTIHKSQGKTFDHAVIDLGKNGAFAAGQTYVALSRCRSFEGLSLCRPIWPSDIRLDKTIVEFFDLMRQGAPVQGELVYVDEE